MTTLAAEMMKNAQQTQQMQSGGNEYRGIITNIKAAELPDETLDEFSNAPSEFEQTALLLWDDTQKVYVNACTANRFSENYLLFCDQLEKNIKQLGSFCLTKAVLEQNGMSFPKLSQMTIRELAGMVGFHLRKAHAALEGIYRDNHILGMTYLNWEFRWAGLDNRLRATEVKIQGIKEGKINTESMLKRAQTFKGEPRTNDKAPSDTVKSLPSHANALPIKGSMARTMLGIEKQAEKEAIQNFRKRERKRRELERLERAADRCLGISPYAPTKEMNAMVNQIKAERLRAELEAEAGSETGQKLKGNVNSETETPPPGMITEAEARKRLMDDAMKRKDQEAILAIPQEDSSALHARWEKYTKRIEREALISRNGPPLDVRKALREKRKKKK